jgi:hypothetical protein
MADKSSTCKVVFIYMFNVLPHFKRIYLVYYFEELWKLPNFYFHISLVSNSRGRFKTESGLACIKIDKLIYNKIDHFVWKILLSRSDSRNDLHFKIAVATRRSCLWSR